MRFAVWFGLPPIFPSEALYSRSCNILLADKSGNMAVVECTPAVKRIRKPEMSKKGSIVCTVNSSTSDEMKRYDDSKENDYDSAKRYGVVMDSFSNFITDDVIETESEAP